MRLLFYVRVLHASHLTDYNSTKTGAQLNCFGADVLSARYKLGTVPENLG